jgi:hypothetical protein
MFAGLPGTGVGGVFYLLLTLWMPVHELIEMAKGRPTSRERWMFIARHWSLFAAVLVTIYFQAWIMRHLIPDGDRAVMSQTTTQTVNTLMDTKTASMLSASTLMALASLGAVVGVVYMLRAGLFLKRLAKI